MLYFKHQYLWAREINNKLTMGTRAPMLIYKSCFWYFGIYKALGVKTIVKFFIKCHRWHYIKYTIHIKYTILLDYLTKQGSPATLTVGNLRKHAFTLHVLVDEPHEKQGKSFSQSRAGLWLRESYTTHCLPSIFIPIVVAFGRISMFKFFHLISLVKCPRFVGSL